MFSQHTKHFHNTPQESEVMEQEIILWTLTGTRGERQRHKQTTLKELTHLYLIIELKATRSPKKTQPNGNPP